MAEETNVNNILMTDNGMDFVTVVSVGSDEILMQKSIDEENNNVLVLSESDPKNSGYVTVLKIGQPNNSPKEVIEEVLVYRLPGERLGFGLKFEGGTKAAEFVKRLFIQSCAPDSPASMVHCSWGKLTEGDEVLNIDSLPVTSMTRIDCVRCLKDSNVVIKLLVRHLYEISEDVPDSNDSNSKQSEDVPHVIGAEKKRTPPPPPPVPPRKIPRRMLKEAFNNSTTKTIPTSETDSQDNNEIVANGYRHSRIQSPRNSGRFTHSRQSPETSRHVPRDRRLSDDNGGPPDAEVYLDLFSQESGCNLSESDDTGSSISTIIDRFGSIPTTTNSSVAGSLPSTPTLIQKQLDMSNITNPFDNNEIDAILNDNYLFSKLASSVNRFDEDGIPISIKTNGDILVQKTAKGNEEASTLQPPMNFQDAPLSYGNENVETVEFLLKATVIENNKVSNMSEMADENGNCIKCLNVNNETNKPSNGKMENRKRPPPPPPSCEQTNTVLKDIKDVEIDLECEGIEVDLPRLVHFVPKSLGSECVETTKLFLENELRLYDKWPLESTQVLEEDSSETESAVPEVYSTEIFNITWGMSSHLATIGEDDEEGSQENYFQRLPIASTPIVIIENADNEKFEQEIMPIVSEVSDTPDDNNRVSDDKVEDVKRSKKEDFLFSGIKAAPKITRSISLDTFEAMEAPPSASRQPPDGDEFPDYHEPLITNKPSRMDITSRQSIPLWKSTGNLLLFGDQKSSSSVRDKIAIFSNASKSKSLVHNKSLSESADNILGAIQEESSNKNKLFKDNKLKRSVSVLCKTGVTEEKPVTNQNNIKSFTDANTPLSEIGFLLENNFEKYAESYSTLPRLHTRSQSLVNINNVDNITPKKDRWSLLTEQRQKSLSKLKGLIIPEKVDELELSNVVDLPEIKSNDPASSVNNRNIASAKTPIVPCQKNISVPSLSTPPWCNSTSSNIITYSPAFKRKGLQLHSENSTKVDIILNEHNSSVTKLNSRPQLKPLIQPNLFQTQEVKITSNLCSTDAPKSLESITSPTRSDCSFEYNNSLDIRTYKSEQFHKINQADTRITLNMYSKGKDDPGKSGDESDNDSAVSSSQSSYISRNSPPISPIYLHNSYISRNNEPESITQQHSPSYDNHRFLKPQSVEAINRKNILASAKCRSGRDLKIGSPLIERKLTNEAAENNTSDLGTNKDELEYNSPKCLRKCATIYEKVPVVSESEEDHPLLNNKQDLFNELKKNESVDVINQIKTNDEKCSLFDATLNKAIVSPQNKIKSIMKENLINNGVERKLVTPKSLNKESFSTSVTDLRKSFEKLTPCSFAVEVNNKNNSNHLSDSKSVQPQKEYISNNKVTANPTKEKLSRSKECKSNEESEVIVLRPEIPGGSVGVTLAGGADYEVKEITVHKIREDSSAHRDGRLRKGDRVISINGKSVDGLTHKELVVLLKEPLPEVLICISKQQKNPLDVNSIRKSISSERNVMPIKAKGPSDISVKQNIIKVVSLEKDAAGLGLSLEGGKDSLLGNMPLLIKKIFKGGAAEKCGNLQVGDELILINETDVSSMSKFEAWSVLKKLPEGITISLTVKR